LDLRRWKMPLSRNVSDTPRTFTLYELARELLQTLEPLKIRRVQEEFSLYTIAKFHEEVDLEDGGISAELAPFLSALTQVEEPGTRGSARKGERTNLVLNRRIGRSCCLAQGSSS